MIDEGRRPPSMAAALQYELADPERRKEMRRKNEVLVSQWNYELGRVGVLEAAAGARR